MRLMQRRYTSWNDVFLAINTLEERDWPSPVILSIYTQKASKKKKRKKKSRKTGRRDRAALLLGLQ